VCSSSVGEYCLGKSDAVTPDLRDAANHILYDSTVDHMRNPSIYVTYHDAQAYPEYLITFRRQK
jgi:poly [ADP-ribose] polymerase 10/14/15